MLPLLPLLPWVFIFFSSRQPPSLFFVLAPFPPPDLAAGAAVQTHIIKPGLAGNVAESQQEDVRSGVPAGERSDPVGSPAQPAPIRRRESQQHRAMDGPGNTAAARKTRTAAADRTRRRRAERRGTARSSRAPPPSPPHARPAVAPRPVPQRAAPRGGGSSCLSYASGEGTGTGTRTGWGGGEISPECKGLSGRGKSCGGLFKRAAAARQLLESWKGRFIYFAFPNVFNLAGAGVARASLLGRFLLEKS